MMNCHRTLLYLANVGKQLKIRNVFHQVQAGRLYHIEQVLNGNTCSDLKKGCIENLISASDIESAALFAKDMVVHENFISESEEQSLFEEVESYLRRLRYEFDHWDNAIHGFRETEKSQWNETNQNILNRLRETALPPGAPQIPFVHVLDLAKDGYIKPHIDSVRFCGCTIAGISLLSPSVLRLVHEKNKSSWADVLLNRRSLYIMKGKVRHEYTHEILKEEESVFMGQHIPRDRRISIICRTAVNSSS